MPDNSHIENVCRLLQQTYARLTQPGHANGERLEFDSVYSNGLIEFAGKQEVLWATVFDGDGDEKPVSIASHLRTSIAEMASKNAKQLVEVDRALKNVCPVLYLKGACLIVENEFHPAPWRSMADIDFLVPRDKLEQVLQALHQLGYRDGGEKYTEALHAHYPMLKKDGFTVGLEVHTRCFRWPVDALLDPKKIWNRAETISTKDGPVQIPHINDRIIHLIVHAQIASNRYARREFLMRDALEFRILCSRKGADLEAIRQQFDSAGNKGHFLSFVAMADRIMQANSLNTDQFRPRDIKWADEAWKGLQDPDSLVWYRRMNVFKSLLVNVVTPVRWSAITKVFLNGEEFVDLINRLRQSLGRGN